MASSLQIGRLILGPPTLWHEPIGDPVTNLGGTPIPAPRQALRHEVAIATLAADGQSDTLTDRLRIRRGLRSMFNNTPLKLQGYFYIIYSDDPEQNGWYVPDFGTLNDIDGSVGLASGVWKLEQAAWLMAGHKRTNREARVVWLKDLRTGTAWRDHLKFVYSTDFSALPALPISTFPHGAYGISNSVSGAALSVASMTTGRDGGICQRATGPLLITTATPNIVNPDLTSASFERSDLDMTKSDVIVYDRRGQLTNPSTGPDTLWEEAYGPDYQWSWLTDGASNDTPVIDNGLVRVRYTSLNYPALTIDLWNGTTYVEQGKATFEKTSVDSGVIFSTWQSAGIVEYTPDRAVIKVVINASVPNDPLSRERIYITVQRGEPSVRFELYTSPGSNGVASDPGINWAPNVNAGVNDINASVIKIDSQGSGSWIPGAAGAGKIVATAGTGSGTGNSAPFNIFGSNVGVVGFITSEDWVALLRCPTAFNTIGPYQTNFVVLQNGANNSLGQTPAYLFPARSNGMSFETISLANHYGYFSLQIGFVATQADQIIEAENMTLGTGTITAVDALASGTGSNTTTATRTTDANPHVSRATWPNSFNAKYRVFARVKTSASTLHVYAKTSATTGAAVTTTSTTYVWMDLGEIVANSSTLEIHCWATAAATVSVDRIESVLVEDRTRVGATYLGARDLGQMALMDSRQIGAVVAR